METKEAGGGSPFSVVYRKETSLIGTRRSWLIKDGDGREISFRDDSGYSRRTEYNANGQKMSQRTLARGEAPYEEKREFDRSGREIHYIITGLTKRNGHSREPGGARFAREQWREYTEEGLLSAVRNSDGYEKRIEYDREGRETHCWDTDGAEAWTKYNRFGLIAEYRTSGGYWEKTEYSAEGKPVLFRNSDGEVSEYKYSGSGKLTGFRSAEGQAATEYSPDGKSLHTVFIGKDKKVEEWSVCADTEELARKTEAALFRKSEIERLKKSAVSAKRGFAAEKVLAVAEKARGVKAECGREI